MDRRTFFSLLATVAAVGRPQKAPPANALRAVRDRPGPAVLVGASLAWRQFVRERSAFGPSHQPSWPAVLFTPLEIGHVELGPRTAVISGDDECFLLERRDFGVFEIDASHDIARDPASLLRLLSPHAAGATVYADVSDQRAVKFAGTLRSALGVRVRLVNPETLAVHAPSVAHPT